MANDLTGDFDVVAEFTLGAANRVLAAMHRGGRLPHSWSLHVDDYAHHHTPLGTPKVTGVRSVVNSFGEPVLDPGVVAKVSGSAASVLTLGPASPNWDSPVNVANVPAAGQSAAAGVHGPVVAGSPATFIETLWKNTSETITITSDIGWDIAIDTIVYEGPA